MNMPFIKIQNAGNDYVYVQKKSLGRHNISASKLAKHISDRHKGVGSDGLIIVDQTSPESAFVTLYNSDGSSMEFCGNGIRGASLYLRKQFNSRKKTFAVSTKFRDYDLKILQSSKSRQVSRLRVGSPDFERASIGYVKKTKTCLGIKIKSHKRYLTAFCVAMPNPHAVIFVDNFDFDWQKDGALIENNWLFRKKINVMFVKIESKRRIAVKSWERGAGETLSCGSGAAAAVVIAGLLGFSKGLVSVVMPGGILKTKWDIAENVVIQDGASELVCAGNYIF